jgi:uncharacterized membrane protein
MTLPEIVLPKITLPFDVPVLLHPFIVHFVVAIPVVVLLLELMNVIMKKKAVGGVSFFLIILTVVAAAGAYLTGLTDGKEAFDALNDTAKEALSEHKLLGIYLLLASGILLLLKLLAMTGNKVLRGLYILALLGFVIVMFKQGKEGGELVYKHGLNVEQVKILDDKVFDLEEALEETKMPVVETPVVEVNTEHEVKVEVTPETVAKDVPTPEASQSAPIAPDNKVQTVAEQPLESTGIEEITPQVQSVTTTTQVQVENVTSDSPEVSQTVQVIPEN